MTNITVGARFKNQYGTVVIIDAVGTDHVMVKDPELNAVWTVSKKTLGHLWTEMREPGRKKAFIYTYHSEPGSWCVQAGADGTPYDYKQDDIKIAGSASITEGKWAEESDDPEYLPF